jgi:hypothetical protein
MDCPTLTVAVQAPTLKDEALKLPATIPVAPNSWLAVLAKLPKFGGGAPFNPSSVNRLVLALKFPEPPLKGVRTAVYNVSPLNAEPPNTQAWVVPEPIGITLPALQDADSHDSQS